MRYQFLLFSFLLFFGTSLGYGQSGPIGWASVNANGQDGTTGGTGGTEVTVTTMTDLITYCSATAPYIIKIDGMITITPKGRYIEVNSNKTVIGIDAQSGIKEGGFRVGSNKKNIIFKNLNITDTFVEGDWDGKEQDWDGIQIKGTCSHIWVDHCTVLRQGDGAIDITNGANYVTVSNSIIGQNNKASLIGSSDTDTYINSYKVTMHHNWFNATTQRNPRVRFGMVHLFNNYYYNMGGYGREMGYATSNGYAIGVGVSAKVYSEKNYFEKVVYPVQFYDNTSLPGYILDNGSISVQGGSVATRPEGISWNPTEFYAYSLDDAETVKEYVMTNAGTKDNPTSANPISNQSLSLDLKCFPNPFTDYTNVVFTLPSSGITTIRLFDIIGQDARVIAHAHFPQGKNEVKLTRGILRPGIYIVQVEFQGSRISRRIIAQ